MSASQKEANNKIRTAFVDPYCDALPNSDGPKSLTQGWIEHYDCCYKTGQVCILR